ncbi:MAG: DUF1810 domain-containing protein [Ramlibacter sp.]|nr:DUF1810 domain-containing protein [Ramlibacter sp.]
MEDRFGLSRFVQAQAAVYPQVVAELRAGRKRSHWMWFVFPQIEGLGHSAMAQRYAVGSLDEARAHLEHPVLGARLRECSALVLAVPAKTAHEIFGSPDDLKFHSSMTLFHRAAPAEPVFGECLRKYFAGQEDTSTLARL